MIFLGFGKWARADRIYALEPITGSTAARTTDARLGRRRPRADRRLAHRAHDPAEMGQDASGSSQVLDDALDLAERLANAADEGRVDLADLGRRARRVLEKTATQTETEQLS